MTTVDYLQFILKSPEIAYRDIFREESRAFKGRLERGVYSIHSSKVKTQY
jgi:hypothetical protein